MGCQFSSPDDNTNAQSTHMGVGKSERGPRASQVYTKAAAPLGSLQVLEEEENLDRLPRLNEAGQLHPEEVVRRTSSSLSVSNISIGNEKSWCGHQIQMQVCR